MTMTEWLYKLCDDIDRCTISDNRMSSEPGAHRVALYFSSKQKGD